MGAGSDSYYEYLLKLWLLGVRWPPKPLTPTCVPKTYIWGPLRRALARAHAATGLRVPAQDVAPGEAPAAFTAPCRDQEHASLCGMRAVVSRRLLRCQILLQSKVTPACACSCTCTCWEPAASSSGSAHACTGGPRACPGVLPG